MEYIKQPLVKNYEASLYKSIDNALAANDWQQVTGTDNLFLQVAYLKALEQSKLEAINYRYVIVYKNNKPAAVFYFQVLALSSGHFEKLSKFNVADDDRHCINELVLCVLKQRTSKRPFYMLICGNLLESGENAFAYAEGINENEASKLLYNVIKLVVKQCGNEFKTAAVLIKDFYTASGVYNDTLEAKKFHAIRVEPNMLMNLQPLWHTFNDYLESLSAKYRTRAKSILKKGEALSKRIFTVSNIQENKETIEGFYNAVHTNDKFNLTTIDTNYFVSMKQTFGDRFIFTGYYIKDKLIGFRSAFVCDRLLEAHYIGVDPDYNKQYEVYQNMLYDFVKTAIEKQATSIAFGRTASEIKTNIGAMAHELTCYIKHTNGIINTFLSSVTKNIKPTPFTARNPFKSNIGLITGT